MNENFSMQALKTAAWWFGTWCWVERGAPCHWTRPWWPCTWAATPPASRCSCWTALACQLSVCTTRRRHLCPLSTTSPQKSPKVKLLVCALLTTYAHLCVGPQKFLRPAAALCFELSQAAIDASEWVEFCFWQICGRRAARRQRGRWGGCSKRRSRWIRTRGKRNTATSLQRPCLPQLTSDSRGASAYQPAWRKYRKWDVFPMQNTCVPFFYTLHSLFRRCVCTALCPLFSVCRRPRLSQSFNRGERDAARWQIMEFSDMPFLLLNNAAVVGG